MYMNIYIYDHVAINVKYLFIFFDLLKNVFYLCKRYKRGM